MSETQAVVCISSCSDDGWRGHSALWRCTVAQARAICSDPRTAGDKHYLIWFHDGPDVALRWITDNGRYADVLAGLGLVAVGRELRQAEEEAA